MVSLRLITTGLDDVHSVIGYELDGESVLIQPRESTSYSYEAMHDINGIAIPELIQRGEDRKSTLKNLLEAIDSVPVLVWYKPFMLKFLNQVAIELGYDRNVACIDLYGRAKQKEFNPPSYRLADVLEFTGTSNLFELYDYLNNLPEPVRRSRV